MSRDTQKNAAKGLTLIADKAVAAVPDAAPNDGKGQPMCAGKSVARLPDPSPQAEAGRDRDADKAAAALPVSAFLDQLAELQVRRKFYIGAANKQTNAVRALVRRALGWRYDEDEKAREKVNARAARIVTSALAGKEQKEEDREIFGALAYDLEVVGAAIEPMSRARHEVELQMKRIVRRLPIYTWAKGVHGFGELGLAVVLAEAGDLSGYPKKGHLWKRLGLAPYNGKALSTWRMKGGLSADEWSEAGYSPRRRAEIYSVVSDPLFRAQSVAKGPYRAIYDARRERTAVAHEDWSKAHSHADGLRVMTKYLLRDLWQEWNRQRADHRVPKSAGRALPDGELDERKAGGPLPQRAEREVPTAHAA